MFHVPVEAGGRKSVCTQASGGGVGQRPGAGSGRCRWVIINSDCHCFFFALFCPTLSFIFKNARPEYLTARHFFPRHCVGPHHCRWPCSESSYRSHRSQNSLPCCCRVQLGRTLPSGLSGTCAREGCPVIAVSEGSPTTPDRVSVFDAATGSLLRHIEGDMKCVSTAGGALR